MKRQLVIGLILVMTLIVGCGMETTNFSQLDQTRCQTECLAIGLNLNGVGNEGEKVICHCEKVIILERGD